MNKFISVVVLAILLPAGMAFGLTLEKGDSRNPSGFQNQNVANQMLQIGAYGLDAFLNIPGDANYYVIIVGELGKINLLDKKYLGNIPLTRWPYQLTAPEQQKAYDTFHMDFPYDTYRIIKLPVNTYGCLSLTPLRYGDIEGDGKNELVLFLGKDMVVFSPEYQRIVFAQTLDAGDWVDAEDTAGAYSRSREGTGQYAVQFLSSLAYSNDAVDIYGVRVYSKIYLGDFDKDNNPDIVVWTKAYRSKLKSDPVPGFDAVRQNWYHFERDLTAQADSPAGVTGEYLPQTTDEATIKTWLTDNALTWKKGYPDVSECAADVGKPIPEMSDPLLNDPEVLQ